MSRALFVLALLVAAAAEASEGAGATWLGLPVLFWKLVNLLAFLLLLGYLLARPASRFFHTRREEIARELAEAEKLRAEAASMQQAMTERMAQLAAEMEALAARVRREGELERERLVAEGEKEAARFLRQVEEEAQRRLGEAREQLARQAAQAAAAAAWDLLQREITPEDRERIFQATLARLAEGGKA